MVKVLVLGKMGMLGHMVFGVLAKEKEFIVHGTQFENKNDSFYFDVISGIEKLESICERVGGYNYFVNCIGVLNSAINKENSDSMIRAIKINSVFPHELAKSADKYGTKVIHMSTDGVFLGKKEKYTEDDLHDCMDVYGQTKSLGEVLRSNVLNIRTSVFGPSPYQKLGLFEWFSSQPEGAVISGYTDYVWCGVTTLQFAELCKKVMADDYFDDLRKKSSVIHFVPNKPISKYELLVLFRKVSKKDIIINPVEVERGPVKRILGTKYNDLKDLLSGDKDIAIAIKDLYERT